MGVISSGCSTPTRLPPWNAEEVIGAIEAVWWRRPLAPELGPRIEQLLSQVDGDVLMTTELSGIAYINNISISRRLEGDTIVATKHELIEMGADREQISEYFRVTDPALAREFRELSAMVRACTEWDGLPLAGVQRNGREEQTVAYIIAVSNSSRPLIFSERQWSRSLYNVVRWPPWDDAVIRTEQAASNATFPLRESSEIVVGIEPSVQQGLYWQIEWFDWRAMHRARSEPPP